ncbi:MAG: rhomboid family intramembrane serine protease [Opitutales bacterium]|nr:rhomboid family intramembrane serine protease [Opitutales bacterium]
MGIGDRAYMRDRSAPRVPISMTAWVVGILVGFFILNLIQESAAAHFLDSMELKESDLRPWQWLTHAFLHEGFWHLLGNCLILWWTGATVEQEHGPATFLKVLVGGALIGALTWYLTGLGGRHDSALIGISAGVYALMLVALLDKLDHQITLLLFFFLPVTLKVRWLLILTALFTLLGWGFSEFPARHAWGAWKPAWHDGIAHSAHLGGLIFGWLAWRYLNRTNWAPSYAQVQEPMPTDAPSPAFETPTEENPSSRPLTSAQARAEMDRLLDKISSGGFGSLTTGEKRRLEELSARLR